MSELEDLIARVEALSGADREVSRDIWMFFDTPEWKYAYLEAQAPCGCPHDQAVEYAARHLPDITASIDAALAFAERVLPEGTNIMLKLRTKGKYYHAEFEDIEFESGEVEDVTAYNQPTLPLAIILATLKAKVSE